MTATHAALLLVAPPVLLSIALCALEWAARTVVRHVDINLDND